MKPTLLILGDSHQTIYKYSNINLYFIVQSIIQTDSFDIERNGKFIPYLMNTIGDIGEKYLTHHIDAHENTEYIMYIFGEPDVRIHLHKQINILGRNEDDVISTLVHKYVNKLLNITPKQTRIIIRYVLPQREYSMYGTTYIPVGDIEDRVRYTHKLNTELKHVCETGGILYYENYLQNELVDTRGILKDKYCDGLTHYNQDALPCVNNEIRIFCERHISKKMKMIF